MDPFLLSGVHPRTLASLRGGGLVPAAGPTPDDLAFRRRSLDELGRAYRLGVSITAGSDTGNPFVFAGYSMHYELELMVEAGMSPADGDIRNTRTLEMVIQGGSVVDRETLLEPR